MTKISEETQETKTGSVTAKPVVERKDKQKKRDSKNVMQVEDLNLWYGSNQALYEINMDIPEKRVTAI
ncbi:MAG: phosphate ABC transporter ATP-binding protein, partial [Halobacillus sp.]